MSRLRVLVPILFLALVGCTRAAAAAEAGDTALSTTDCSFGEVYAFSEATCKASLHNDGATPLTLTIKSVEPGNRVEPSHVSLPPHASKALDLHVQTDNIAGTIGWSFRIDGAPSGPQFIKAEGFVNSIVDQGHPTIAFKSNDASTLPVSQSLSLASSIDPAFRLLQVLHAPVGITTKIGTDGKSIVADIDKDAPWGYFEDFVKLSTNSDLQRQVWVAVNGTVVGDVAPSTNPYWLGEIPWQPNRELKVTVLDRSGRDFSIGKVTSNDFAATYDSAPCEPQQKGCRDIVVRVAESQQAGLFKAHLDVELSNRNRHLQIQIFGALQDRPTLGETAAPTVMQKVALPNSTTVDGVSISPELKVLPDPPGRGPLLKWTIAQQSGVHGFQIFRGDTENGPFGLMTPETIAKVDNGTGPVAYRWRDTTAETGRTYWYYIAALSTSGDRKPLSAPHKTVAK